MVDVLDCEGPWLIEAWTRTAAPWARGFPTVAEWDDAAGQLLAQAARFRSPDVVVAVARSRQVIGAVDAERLTRLAALADDHAPVGLKLGNRAVAEADNLILALAELAAAALAGAAPTGQAELARRSGATLADTAEYVRAFAETRPPDLREALLALSDEGRRLERAMPHPAGVASEPSVPEDVEKQVRQMILRGEEPPSQWFPFIRRLYFTETPLESLSLLRGLIGLQTLSLRQTRVGDVSVLTELKGLHSLNLRGAPVTDISALAGLKDLQNLYLNGTRVIDLSPLAGLNGLQVLDLSGIPAADISALVGLRGLRTLFLRGTRVTEISPLRHLTGLRLLDLTGIPVTDLSALTDLTSLRTLSLRATRVTDLSPLTGLTELRSVDVRDTQIQIMNVPIQLRRKSVTIKFFKTKKSGRTRSEDGRHT